MNDTSSTTDKRFDKIDERMDDIEGDVSDVKKQLTQVTERDYDYLDKRVSETKGESISLVRKEDSKLATTIELLKKKDVISEQEQNVLLRMEPFPKLIP